MKAGLQPNFAKRRRMLQLPAWLVVSFACSFASAASLQLQFVHTFNGSPLELNSQRYALASGETLSVSRLSYLLSGFALERTEGGWVELTNQYAWLDAERGRQSVVMQDVQPGAYRAVRFAVGLDPQTNKGDPAKYPAEHPLNPNLNSLHWSWQGGYIFLALEGSFQFRAAGFESNTALDAPNSKPETRNSKLETNGFSYHFARNPNRTVVTLPLQLSLARKESAAVGITFDLASLLNAPRSISPPRDGVSTHSREGDPLAAALRAKLPSAFQVREVMNSTLPSSHVSTKPLYLPETFTPYPLRMSERFPVPDLPRDNPLIVERVELGKRLFHEPLLSRNNSLSCASCHEASHAFSDPRRFSLGVEGQPGTRQAMPLFNLAWKNSFFWDGRAPSLRAQALMPIQDHAEMDESLENVCAKLGAEGSGGRVQDEKREPPKPSPLNSKLETRNSKLTDYPTLFARAFGSPDITPEKIGLAIENYLLTLTSFDSKFDRALRGQGELSEEEKRGFELFFTEYDPRMGQHGADCFHCHGGALFSNHQFHNNGLGVSEADPGRYKVTRSEADRGKFATPSLRNVALTAPYMHDGRFGTLEEVVEHYSSGVKRESTLDPNLAKHPEGGLQLSAQDKRALVAFLKTLTDGQYGIAEEEDAILSLASHLSGRN
jgi:cytochrome c peroxidase